MKDKFMNLKNDIMNYYRGNKTIIRIGIAICIVIIMVIIIFCALHTKKTSTTNGNLRNYGFATIKGNTVYYLSLDGYTADGIYKVNKSGNKTEKISNDYAVYMNIEGNYIYYIDIESHNIVKIKNNGKNKVTLIEDVDELPIAVEDGWIYYSKDGEFSRVKLNGKKEQKLSSKLIKTYQIVGDSIYYTYYNDGSYVLSKMKLNGDKVEKINSNLGTSFYIKDEIIYYIYENSDFEYELYKMKMNGKDKEQICKIQGMYIDYINMSDEGIYYFGEDDSGKYGIYHIKYNGKGKTKIVDIEGYETYINIIDNYVFYMDNDSQGDTYTYKIKTNGKNKVQL